MSLLRGFIQLRQQILVGPIYDNADAADPVNENNNAANWLDYPAQSGLTIASITQETGATGDYMLQFVHSAATAQESRIVTFPCENGASYTITVDAKVVAETGNWSMALRTGHGWTANTSTVFTATVGTWGADYEITGTTDDTTASLRIGTNTSGAVSDEMYLDNIRIVKN